MTRPAPPARTERATALVLVPAMALVLFVLAGVAVDLTALHTVQRTLQRVASGAADDAAAMIDTRRVQIDGDIVVDPDRARLVAEHQVRSAQLPGRLERIDVRVERDRVEVRVEVMVRHGFLGTFPGAPDAERVAATARARLWP